MFAALRNRLKNKEGLKKQIDIIDEQYRWLMKDYAEVKKQFQDLQYRKVQLQKQIDNLKAAIKEEDDGKSF